MAETIKYILLWLFIFIVGSLIVTFILSPNSFNSFKSNAKSISADIIRNIKSLDFDTQPVNNSFKVGCKAKAEDLIPKYIILGDENYWGDRQPIDIYETDPEVYHYSSCLRKGINEGENINHDYYICEGFNYNKKIIYDNGRIKGDRIFLLNNVSLNKIDTDFSWEGNLERLFDISDGGMIKEETTTLYKIFWRGFDKEIKKMIGVDSLKIRIYSQQYYITNRKGDGDYLFCEEELIEEKGIFECEIDPNYFDKSQIVYTKQEGRMVTGKIVEINVGKELVVEISPNIVKKNIYELVGYEIDNCDWVI